MPDYREMYFKMAGAMEKAVRILVEAQQQAEEIYLAQPGPDIRPFPAKGERSDT